MVGCAEFMARCAGLQDLSEEEVFQANTLGWCIELVGGPLAYGRVHLS